MKAYFQSLIVFTLLTSACVSVRESGGPKSSQRLEIPKEGIILEAHYDPRLDSLIPGYKVLNVGVTNQGTDIIRFNPLKDRWEIVDAYGKSYRASNSLRIKAPEVWSRLPSQVQQLIEYPAGVSVGYSETVDLFFPANVDLNSFRSISFYSADKKTEYNVLSNFEAGPPAETVLPGKAPAPLKGKTGKKLLN